MPHVGMWDIDFFVTGDSICFMLFVVSWLWEQERKSTTKRKKNVFINVCSLMFLLAKAITTYFIHN